MNFKQQLQEAYEAGYRQSLQEAVDDAYEAYERGEINEEQLDEIVGLITRGISAIPKIGKGLKKGYDFVRKSFRRPVVKKTDIDQQVKDFLATRPPPARTPSQIEKSKRVRALRKYFDEPGSISDDELRALGIRVERPPIDLDDALFGPLG